MLDVLVKMHIRITLPGMFFTGAGFENLESYSQSPPKLRCVPHVCIICFYTMNSVKLAF